MEREERLRIGELRQKNSLRVELRLLQTLRIDQPKLLLQAALVPPKRPSVRLPLVWDPLLDAVEAVTCPVCRKPSFSLAVPVKGGSYCCERCLENLSPGKRS